MKQRQASFIVTFPLPEGASVARAQDYVLDAVQTMKGSLQPPGYGPGGFDPNEEGDPMFELDYKSVRVKRYRRPKKVST